MNQIQIAAKLYEARDNLKTLFPDDFKTKCQEWQEVIRKVAAGKQMTDIKAMIDIMQHLEGKEIAQMWVMAAYVEMIEPI